MNTIKNFLKNSCKVTIFFDESLKMNSILQENYSLSTREAFSGCYISFSTASATESNCSSLFLFPSISIPIGRPWTVAGRDIPGTPMLEAMLTLRIMVHRVETSFPL